MSRNEFIKTFNTLIFQNFSEDWSLCFYSVQCSYCYPLQVYDVKNQPHDRPRRPSADMLGWGHLNGFSAVLSPSALKWRGKTPEQVAYIPNALYWCPFIQDFHISTDEGSGEESSSYKSPRHGHKFRESTVVFYLFCSWCFVPPGVVLGRAVTTENRATWKRGECHVRASRLWSGLFPIVFKNGFSVQIKVYFK